MNKRAIGYFTICISVGLIVGIATHNITLWLAIGVCIGTSLDVVTRKDTNKRD